MERGDISLWPTQIPFYKSIVKIMVFVLFFDTNWGMEIVRKKFVPEKLQ